MKYTREEFLAEAKKRYPIGSVVKQLWENRLYPIKIENHNIAYPNDYPREFWFNKGNCAELACVYLNGKWTEIISYPEGYVKEVYYEIY